MLTKSKNGGGYLTNPTKKKAFTLVELIGVVAVLSVMLLVIVPVVMNTIKNNDKRKYQDFEKAITNAAEAYVESNKEAYPTIDSEGKAVVRLSYIINEGYLKSNIKDPSTKKSISPNTYVTVLKQDDNTLEYIYGGKDCELSDSNETEFVGTAKPEDVLDGKTFYGNSSNLQTGILKKEDNILLFNGSTTRTVFEVSNKTWQDKTIEFELYLVSLTTLQTVIDFNGHNLFYLDIGATPTTGQFNVGTGSSWLGRAFFSTTNNFKLNDWNKIKIEFKEGKTTLYINDNNVGVVDAIPTVLPTQVTLGQINYSGYSRPLNGKMRNILILN